MLEVKMDASKFARRAAAAGGDYASGVRSPRRSQSEAAIASKDVYAQAIQEAISEGRYEKGLQRAGDAKWQRKVAEVGQARFQQGVANAGDEWNAGFAPYADTLRSLTLEPRGPKGQNYGRVQAVGEALRDKKKSL